MLSCNNYIVVQSLHKMCGLTMRWLRLHSNPKRLPGSYWKCPIYVTDGYLIRNSTPWSNNLVSSNDKKLLVTLPFTKTHISCLYENSESFKNPVKHLIFLFSADWSLKLVLQVQWAGHLTIKPVRRLSHCTWFNIALTFPSSISALGLGITLPGHSSNCLPIHELRTPECNCVYLGKRKIL